MHEVTDKSPAAEEARARAVEIARAMLASFADAKLPEPTAANAMAIALVLIAQNSEFVAWQDIVTMLRAAATGIELLKAETPGGMH